MKKFMTMFIAMILCSIARGDYLEHLFKMDWYGEKYTVTLSGDIFERSAIQWDGSSDLPCSLNKSILSARAWIEKTFPDMKYNFAYANLYFFSDNITDDNPTGYWGYMIEFRNGRKELVKPANYWKMDQLFFYVLMDGTLITPEKAAEQ